MAAAPRRRWNPEHSGWVLVSFMPGSAPPDEAALRLRLSLLPTVPVRRLISATRQECVRHWQAVPPCEEPCGWSRPGLISLAETWRVFTGADAALAHRLVGEVDVATDVRSTWWERTVTTASRVDFPDDPRHRSQHHLSSLRGVGARPFWRGAAVQIPGSAGEQMRLVSVELGWDEAHPDLPLPARRIAGESITSSPHPDEATSAWYRRHGTNALGVMVSRDNERGGIGLAPKVAEVLLASAWQPATASPPAPRVAAGVHIADAIVAGILASRPGDVIQLGLQRGLSSPLPVEVDPADLTAIQLATHLGRVVVLPSGNGRRNLDDWVSPVRIRTGRRVRAMGAHLGTGLDQIDSGAVVVSATWWRSGAHERHPLSNHGSRVDCCAPGDEISTAGAAVDAPIGSDGTEPYTDRYGHTSAAAAITAGVAVSVQGAVRSRQGQPLSPAALRDRLQAERFTRPTASTDAIGRIPELSALLVPPPPRSATAPGWVPLLPGGPAQSGWGTSTLIGTDPGAPELGGVVAGGTTAAGTWVEEWMRVPAQMDHETSFRWENPHTALGGSDAIHLVSSGFPTTYFQSELDALLNPPPTARWMRLEFAYYTTPAAALAAHTDGPPGPPEAWATFELSQAPFSPPPPPCGKLLRYVHIVQGQEYWTEHWILFDQFVRVANGRTLLAQVEQSGTGAPGPGLDPATWLAANTPPTAGALVVVATGQWR